MRTCLHLEGSKTRAYRRSWVPMAPSHRSCFVPRSCAFTIRWQFYCGRCKRTGWDLQPRSTFLRDRGVSGFGSKQPLPWSRARPGGWLHSREAVVKWPLRKQWSCFSSRLCCTLPNQESPLTLVQDTSILAPTEDPQVCKGMAPTF